MAVGMGLVLAAVAAHRAVRREGGIGGIGRAVLRGGIAVEERV